MATSQTLIVIWSRVGPWAIVDSGFTCVGNKMHNAVFDNNGDDVEDDDSRQIQHQEDKSTFAKNTASQAQISCPIQFIKEVFTMAAKRIYEFFCGIRTILHQIKKDLENIRRFILNIVLQHIKKYLGSIKRFISNIVHSLSNVFKICVIKTCDYICLIYFVVNNNENYNNKMININIIHKNSDDNDSNNEHNNDYDDNCDNNISNNCDIYNTNNYKLHKDGSKTDNITQSTSTAISNESECVEDIPNNIPSRSETPDNTINNFEQPSTEGSYSLPSSTSELRPLLPISHFKSFVSNVNTQEDIDDVLCLPFSYQYMFDKRTSPWEMKDWDHEELNNFAIEPENIDRLYHMVADDEDQNFRSWEICCRIVYKGEKYFVEMYANCDYTGFDCQGGGHISITKLPDFFLENMVTMDQSPDQIYKSLREDGYNVQEPDLLHKVHPKFWNNAPMLKYLCHNAIYKHRDVLPHFKDELPIILANSVDDFIKVKDWDNE